MSGGSHHSWLVVSLICFFVATSSVAQAQTWLSDRKRAEGGGLRLGDLELHPGIGAEVGYINNVYNADDGDEIGSAALRVAPHLFLSTLTEERSGEDTGQTPGFVRFRGGLSASLQHYFDELAPDTSVGADANLQLTLAPERPLSFTVTEVLNRSFRPFSDIGNEPAARPEGMNFIRYTNTLGARLLGQTRGGLLQGGLGYRLAYSWFDDEGYAVNDNLIHTAELSGAWEFLPKTALFYEVAYAYQNYTENEQPTEDPTREPLEDNHQVTTRLGINGAITARISGTLAVGYAAGFFGGNDFEGLTLNAEGRWTPSEISEWGLGYERSYGSAYQGNFVLKNQIYTRLRFFIGGAFVIASKLAVEFLDFGPDLSQGGEVREDLRFSGDLSAEYRFIDWLAVTAQLSAVIDDTDYSYEYVVLDADGDEVMVTDPAEFKTFEGWLGLRAFF